MDPSATTAAPPPDPAKLLQDLVAGLTASYDNDDATHHIGAVFLPSRAKVIQLIELCRCLVFPGFFDDQRLTQDSVADHTRGLLSRAHALLQDQVNQSLRYEQNKQGLPAEECGGCDDDAARITAAILLHLPEIRRLLATDVRAAFDGDPAAKHTDEAIFCYPGIDAIFIHRVAHQLYRHGLPLLARIAAEYAHNETGIDIHPGATIGPSFFIDHGTGVVIGETTTIGQRVKLYQGVTLGALSTKGGQDWRDRKRHPTIEDDVTLYAGATVLGGRTTVGRGATINGGVFLTDSVPPGVVVGNPPVELHIRAAPADHAQPPRPPLAL